MGILFFVGIGRVLLLYTAISKKGSPFFGEVKIRKLALFARNYFSNHFSKTKLVGIRFGKIIQTSSSTKTQIPSESNVHAVFER